MTLHFNKKIYTPRRRLLRHHLSKAEAVMWKNLSRKQMMKYKFRRQYGVDNYVIDFYCPKLKLAIEIDGDSHFLPGAKDYDANRQQHIEQFGIQFLRFTNFDVLDNINGVLQAISDKILEIEKKKSDGFSVNATSP